MDPARCRHEGQLRTLKYRRSRTSFKLCEAIVTVAVQGKLRTLGGTIPATMCNSFTRDLCRVLAVPSPTDLVCMPVIVLTAWDAPDAVCIGLENYNTHARFLLSEWGRRHGVPTKTALERETMRVLRRVRDTLHEAAEHIAQLNTASKEFITWEEDRGEPLDLSSSEAATRERR